MEKQPTKYAARQRRRSNILWHLHHLCIFIEICEFLLIKHGSLVHFDWILTKKAEVSHTLKEVMDNNVTPEIFHLNNYSCYWNIFLFINLVCVIGIALFIRSCSLEITFLKIFYRLRRQKSDYHFFFFYKFSKYLVTFTSLLFQFSIFDCFYMFQLVSRNSSKILFGKFVIKSFTNFLFISVKCYGLHNTFIDVT